MWHRNQRRNALNVQAGLHTYPCLSSPEAGPEAKAHILLLIKEYDSQEVGVGRRGVLRDMLSLSSARSWA